jgi:hypothetical protein
VEAPAEIEQQMLTHGGGFTVSDRQQGQQKQHRQNFSLHKI